MIKMKEENLSVAYNLYKEPLEALIEGKYVPPTEKVPLSVESERHFIMLIIASSSKVSYVTEKANLLFSAANFSFF